MLLIFDLDGTLLNTIRDLGEACNVALQHAGFPTHETSEYPRLVGNGVNNLIRRALPAESRTEETILTLRRVFVEYYDKHDTVFTHPYDGIDSLLHRLKAEGHLLAVASNKYDAAAKAIVEHYFPKVFDVVMGEREGVERKPSPAIVTNIEAALQCRDIIYIGDSNVDIETAKNASVPVIACSWGFCTRETIEALHPDYIADNAEELYSHIKKLIK